MTRRVLPFDYTADQLDEGYGMRFHPVGGLLYTFADNIGVCEKRPLYRSDFNDAKRRYYRGLKSEEGVYMLPRIGDGSPRIAGEPYLVHWTNDPFTGELIDRNCFVAKIEAFFARHEQLKLRFGDVQKTRGFREKYFESSKDQLVHDYERASEQDRQLFDEYFAWLTDLTKIAK